MRAQMKRIFALLLTTLLVIDSQSSACSSLISLGVGARHVLAADITEDQTDQVAPDSVKNVVVTGGDTTSVDFPEEDAFDVASLDLTAAAAQEESVQSAAENTLSESGDPAFSDSFDVQTSDTEITEGNLSAASADDFQSLEEWDAGQAAESEEASAADVPGNQDGFGAEEPGAIQEGQDEFDTEEPGQIQESQDEFGTEEPGQIQEGQDEFGTEEPGEI